MSFQCFNENWKAGSGMWNRNGTKNSISKLLVTPFLKINVLTPFWMLFQRISSYHKKKKVVYGFFFIICFITSLWDTFMNASFFYNRKINLSSYLESQLQILKAHTSKKKIKSYYFFKTLCINSLLYFFLNIFVVNDKKKLQQIGQLYCT